MDSVDALKPSHGVSEPEGDTEAEAEADTDETIHDFDEDTFAEDVVEGPVDEEDANRQLTQAGKKAVKRNAVEDNIEANAEDDHAANVDDFDDANVEDTDEAKGVSNPEKRFAPRMIPSRIADIADKAVEQAQDGQQYDD